MSNFSLKFQRFIKNYSKILKDVLNILSFIYPKLLLINVPTIIFLNPEQILKFNFWIVSGLTFYSLSKIIYFLLIFPYLQAVSILYIFNHQINHNYKISHALKISFLKILPLFCANLLMLLRLGMVFILGFPIVYLGSFLLGITFRESLTTLIMMIFVSLMLILVFYIYTNFFLTPHFILLENCDIEDSCYNNIQLIRQDKISVFLMLLFAGFFYLIPTFLCLFFLSKIETLSFFLYQPVLFTYYVVIYNYLKDYHDLS